MSTVNDLQCKKCGYKFPKSTVLSRMLGGEILVDPAPSPFSFIFRKERCPKCGSSSLKKI